MAISVPIGDLSRQRHISAREHRQWEVLDWGGIYGQRFGGDKGDSSYLAYGATFVRSGQECEIGGKEIRFIVRTNKHEENGREK